MDNLQVEIDKNSGFCFGVVYAIQMAEEILDEGEKLYCLGDIVHNEEEVSRLQAKGLEIINHDALANLYNTKVLIRAHGEPPSTYALALKNGIELIDASCPVVLKLQHRVRESDFETRHMLIFGKQGHAEVAGLLGQVQGNATVFMDLAELDLDKLPKRLTLFSQTTKSMQKYYAIAEKLKSLGFDVAFNDTICRQVSNRDGELRNFAAKHNVIVFVAGKKSSNGKVLFDVCKSVNSRTYFVSSISDISMKWFNSGESIGICGATSTPQWQMEQVRDAILSNQTLLIVE